MNDDYYDYAPDAWQILELTGEPVKNGPIHKLLSGWYGGYAGSDSWRLSSGIEKIVEGETYWDIINYSGSIYRCHKNCERMTMLMMSQFQFMSGQAEKGGITMRRVPIAEIPIV